MAFGTTPLNQTFFGFGAVSTTETDSAEKLFPRTDGTQGTGNKLTARGEFEVDSRGRPVGGSIVAQKVFIHLFTERGSTPDLNFGRRPWPRVLTETTLPLFELTVRDALSPLIQSGEIKLVKVSTQLGAYGRVGLRIEWLDLVSGRPEFLDI